MATKSLLPIFQSESKDLGLLQTTWSSIINPVIGRTQNQSNILKSVALTVGDNTINHLLSRPLAGWKVVRQRAASSLFDKQDSNPTPQLTLVLNASAAVVLDIEVF